MKLPDWRKLVSRKRKQTPGWKNFVSAMRNLIPNKEKLASVGRKFVPGKNKGKYCAQGPAFNLKTTLHKALPYVLVVVFALATFASVVGVNSTNTDFISLQGTQNELETQKQALFASQQELEGVLNETKNLLGQLTALNGDMQELLEKAEAEGGAVSDKIDQLQNALQDVEKQEQQRWQLPIQYTNCSSPYGYRTHPVAGESKFHYGVDLCAPKGTAIVASRSGTVTLATYDDSSGNYVVIDHLDGYRSAYMHMDRYIVTEGQFVLAGQIIGYCGNTGVSTDYHLHFVIYHNGQTVDPAEYIDMY